MSDKRTWRRGWLSVPLVIALALGACAKDEQAPNWLSGAKGDEGATADQIAGTGVMQALAARVPGKFDLVRDKASQWKIRLVGPKGDVYITGNAYSYAEKRSALNAILSIKENGVISGRYRKINLDDYGKRCSFELLAGNLSDVMGYGPTIPCHRVAATIEATRELITDMVRFQASVAGDRFAMGRDREQPVGRQWYFQLLDKQDDGNDVVLLKSQFYTRRTDAVTGINAVRRSGQVLARYDIDSDRQPGQHCLVLQATGNYAEIASSCHASRSEAERVRDLAMKLLTSGKVGNPW